MNNSQEYLLNKALGKDVNPKLWRIVQVQTPNGQPRQWRFPDNSMMTEEKAGNGILIGLDEIK